MKKVISLACLVSSHQVFGGTLVVLNKSEATASLVDLQTRKVTATLQTGIGPHEVAVSPDGQIAVVANYGDKEAGHTLTLLDLPKARVLGEISLGNYLRPHGISFTGSSNEILVTAEDQETVVKVDLIQRKVVGTLSTKQKISHMLVVDARNKRAFVSNIGTNVVTVLDLQKNEKLMDVQTDKGPEGIDYSEARNEVWVANRSANTLSVIDATALTIKSTLKTGEFPIRVKLTPDQKRVLVTNAQSGSLTIFDAMTKKALKTIQFPKGNMDTAGKMFGDAFKDSSVPIGIALDPQANQAFIAHASLDQISILDLKKLELVGSLQAGREPDGMAYSSITIKK